MPLNASIFLEDNLANRAPISIVKQCLVAIEVLPEWLSTNGLNLQIG
jgi:hypothetical protein